MAVQRKTAAEAPPDRTATGKQVCAAFGFGHSSLTRWVRRGCPVTKSARPGFGHLYNLEEVAAWARKVGLTAVRGKNPDPELTNAPPETQHAMADAKLRIAIGQARKYELAVQKIEGSLVDRAEAEDRLTRICAAFVALLDGVPAKLAGLLAPIEDEVDIESVLRDAFEEIRRAITDEARAE